MDQRHIFDSKPFEVDGEVWTAEVENFRGASAGHTDVRIFMLVLKKNGTNESRRLKLLASHAGIQVENHTPMLYQCARDFLRTGQPIGEVKCF